MPGHKPKCKYKKTRKRKGFSGVPFWNRNFQEAQVCQEQGQSNVKSNEGEGQPRPQDQNGTSLENRAAGFVSVSKRKLETHQDTPTTSKIPRPDDDHSVDMSKSRPSRLRARNSNRPFSNTMPEQLNLGAGSEPGGRDESEAVSGYRLIDMEILGNAIKDAHRCKNGMSWA